MGFLLNLFYALIFLFIWCAALPTVSETKLNFLKAYKRPIPSIYNSVLLELIVQQHLIRYKRTYSYDPVFALGFVTVYDQLMDGYPSDEDREAIFQAYIKALNEDPEQYRFSYLDFTFHFKSFYPVYFLYFQFLFCMHTLSEFVRLDQICLPFRLHYSNSLPFCNITLRRYLNPINFIPYNYKFWIKDIMVGSVNKSSYKHPLKVFFLS